MKKTILFLLFLPVISIAQQAEIPANKNELGLNLFSVTRLESYRGMVDQRDISAVLNAFSGIYYKRHFGKNALRTSFDYSQKSKVEGYGSSSFEDPFWSSYFLSAKIKNVGISIGYERKFGSGKFQPYVFSDLVFNYENMSGVRSEYGCFGPIGVFEFSEERFEYGASAGAGLRYNINSKIHLSYEFSAQGVVSVFQDLSNIGYKCLNMDYHLNPVNRIGFAVSF